MPGEVIERPNRIVEVEPLLPMPTNEAELERCLADQRWRLFSGCLYKIMIKGDNGEEQPTTRLGGGKEFCGVKGSQLVA